MNITDVNRQSGPCLSRVSIDTTPVFDIYVSNEITDDWSTFDYVGHSENLEKTTVGLSYSEPLFSVEDALVRAKEVAGLYMPSVTVEVNVHLFKGDHYALETRGGSTLPYYERT